MNDEGEQRMDDEWTKEEIMEDVIEYYKDKDRHMIELVGNLREEVERLREQFKLVYDWVDHQFPDGGVQDLVKYIGDDEE